MTKQHVTGDTQVVVVAVDGSPASRAAARWAYAHAARSGATVRMVGIVAADAGEQDARARAAVLDEVVGEVAAPGDLAIAPPTVRRGEPVDVLLLEAQDADLLVLGRHSRRGLIHSALGSVGDVCARVAPCPVVIVPGPDDVAGRAG